MFTSLDTKGFFLGWNDMSFAHSTTGVESPFEDNQMAMARINHTG